MSSLTSRADHGDNSFDRQNLIDDEVTGDGQGTSMITTSWRIDLWHQRDQLRTGPSTTPAMAATIARQCYSSNRRPVAVKQTTREEPGAHPEHVEGDGRAEGTTERRVDGHSDHGGANHIGDGVQAAAMVKRIK